MLFNMFTGMLTGTLFGIVLYKVGAIRFSRVVGMFLFRDPKILKFALGTVAISSLIYGSASIFGFSDVLNLTPRVMPFLGWAHLLGGVIFGIVMGLTGLCPGTSVVHTGSGLCVGGSRSVVYAVMVGLVSGIIAFNFLKTPLIDSGILPARPLLLTLNGVLGASYGPVAIVFGAFLLIVILSFDQFQTKKEYKAIETTGVKWNFMRDEWHWLAGSIGMASLICITTMQGQYAGFSGCVLAFVGMVADLFGIKFSLVPVVNDTIYWRSFLIIGLLLGAYLAKRVSGLIPDYKDICEYTPGVDKKFTVPKGFDTKAVFSRFSAGFFLSLGAMIGGGCTSGAFLAAWPTLSIGSLCMGTTFFVIGILSASIFRRDQLT